MLAHRTKPERRQAILSTARRTNHGSGPGGRTDLEAPPLVIGTGVQKHRVPRCWLAMVVASACLTFAAHAAAGPLLKIDKAKLKAAFHCTREVANASREPIMLSTGTLSSGTGLYGGLKGALDAYRHPVCYVDYPHFTTADIQNSVQYLVYGIRKMAHIAGRPGAVYGISQGALLPRVALTYWPRLRRKVTDVVAVAGTQHGTTVASFPCSSANPCPPAIWQQAAGSNFLKALNRQPDESPGKASWTTVRTLDDELVQPQTGKHPTSALNGAANLVIQSVCPDRHTSHIGAVFDSVSFAALVDAVAHKGPARVSSLPGDVCSHEYAPGLDEQLIDAVLAALPGELAEQLALVPKVNHEPRVRGWLKRGP
jgi:triacylglycerol lipase